MIADAQVEQGNPEHLEADGPSTKGENGRDGNGRFTKGWKGGPGNPYAHRVAELRAALLEAVTGDDLRAIVVTLVAKAKGGDIAAIKVLFDRVLGRTPDPTLLDLRDAEERRLELAQDRVWLGEDRLELAQDRAAARA